MPIDRGVSLDESLRTFRTFTFELVKRERKFGRYPALLGRFPSVRTAVLLTGGGLCVPISAPQSSIQLDFSALPIPYRLKRTNRPRTWHAVESNTKSPNDILCWWYYITPFSFHVARTSFAPYSYIDNASGKTRAV